MQHHLRPVNFFSVHKQVKLNHLKQIKKIIVPNLTDLKIEPYIINIENILTELNFFLTNLIHLQIFDSFHTGKIKHTASMFVFFPLIQIYKIKNFKPVGKVNSITFQFVGIIILLNNK